MKYASATQFDKWQIKHTFTIIGLIYRTHLEWEKKSINVIQCSWVIKLLKIIFKIYKNMIIFFIKNYYIQVLTRVYCNIH
jgi:hypothetical protein